MLTARCHAAVRKVSLSVDKGQIVTIIGPNGAGKTTLLAALMGLLPSRGQTTYEDTDIAPLSTEQRVRRGICLVPERRELFTDELIARLRQHYRPGQRMGQAFAAWIALHRKA